MPTPPPLPTRRALLGLPLLAAALGGCRLAPHAMPHAPSPATREAADSPLRLTLHARLRHWVDLPAGYADAPGRRWPLIVFLHGSGERGDDLARVRVHGLPRQLDEGAAVPAIVVSPQCPPDHDWDAHWLHALLLDLRQRLRIDSARVTATGLSMGGAGCWDWASAYPQDLAGIAPVCGFGRWLRVARMRDVPVRAYHGLDDTVVPPEASRALVAAHRAAGGQAELTLYPGVGHDAWVPAYADPGLLPWLLAQQRA